MKQIKHFSTVIYGATSYGIGLASQSPDETLIIERTSLVAPEFIDSLHVGNCQWDPSHLLGLDLKNELLRRNILSLDGRLNMPAVASVLFDFIQQNCIYVLFNTNITEIRKIDSIFEITIYNNSGFQKITADRILDTSQSAEISPNLGKYILGKGVNAKVISNSSLCDDPMFKRGLLKNEFILCCPLELEDDWIEARKKLHTYWQGRDEKLKDWNLVSISSTFVYSVASPGPYEVQDNWIWMPSNAYGNLLQSFEAGLKGGVI